jgi:hypothetical protein
LASTNIHRYILFLLPTSPKSISTIPPTMKFVTSLLMAVVGQAAAIADVRINSSLGQKIMTNARRSLEDNNNENQYYDYEADNSWLANYSIKFQGCHSQLQYNLNADDDSDAMIYNKQLARFRLCPSDSCDSSSAGGCSNSAEYVVEMGTFADAWTEAQMEAQEYKCEKYRETYCDCDGGDDDDADSCQYQCFANANMAYCQESDEDEEEFEVQRYLECAEMDQYNNGEEEEEADDQVDVAYYVGPYCSDDGSKILLGVFTDDTCSVAASTSTYATYNNGVSLPYSSSSIVSLDCLSCMEDADDNGDDADANDADEVKEMCGDLYQAAGKCEQDFSYSSNSDACNFIQGIQIKRKAGDYSYSTSPSKAAGAFIGIFAVSTTLLGAYVYYLHSKLQRSQVALN